jgi:hypothetical protein
MSPVGLKPRITVLAKANSNLVDSIVIGYGQDDWGCVPFKGRDLSLCRCAETAMEPVKTNCGTCVGGLTSYSLKFAYVLW